MALSTARPSLSSILRLEATRGIARRPLYRLAAATTFMVYTLASMLIGGMLVLVYPPSSTLTPYAGIIGHGQPWWSYPALIVVTPGYILALPYFATVAMVVAGLGVGLGMTSSVFLGVQLIRRRRDARRLGTAGVGAIAGLSPALISLVTLGACCSVTASALAGISWTASTTGTTVNALLLNNWYPGVFQLTILYVALVAQEELLRTFGTPGAETLFPSARPPGRDRRTFPRIVGGWVVRVALLVGGTTWLLALPAEWTATTPIGLTVPFVFQAVVGHLVPSVIAIAAALFPDRLIAALARPAGSGIRTLLPRLGAIIAGISLLAWFPPGWVGQQAFGWGNDLLGAVGAPASWGAYVPPGGGAALAFQWMVQLGLLGGFSLIAGLFPDRLSAGLGLLERQANVWEDPRADRVGEPTYGLSRRTIVIPPHHRDPEVGADAGGE